MEVSFNTPFSLLASPLQYTKSQSVSFLLFEFEGAVITQKDLGMGVTLNESQEIPCKSTLGLLPLTGNSIKCILYA